MMKWQQTTNNIQPFKELLADIEKQLRTRVFGKEKPAAVECLKTLAAKQPLVIYGCAHIGKELFCALAEAGVHVSAFGDSYKAGLFCGREIMCPAKLRREHPDAVIVIATALAKSRQEIAAALLKAGFSENSFEPCIAFTQESGLLFGRIAFPEFMEKHLAGYEWAYDFFRDDISRAIITDRVKGYLLCQFDRESSSSPQYFEKGVVRLAEGEIFLDGGCFDGETAAEFIRQMQKSGKEYGHVYRFEPDGGLCRKAGERLRGARVTIVPKGLWSSSGQLTFYATGSWGASFFAGSETNGATAGTVVPVVALDSFFAGVPEDKLPTFIKYDLEGAEKEALLGAAGIIGRKRPKLAVSVYHKPEDIYELPRLIWEMHPYCRFTLRHYTSGGMTETVMYAVDGRDG
jgi:FkbM family methyltransferase